MVKGRAPSIHSFRETVWSHYDQHARSLPWRLPEPDGTFDAYKILVSEFMLQQTGVGRVIPKYQLFLEKFPTLRSLALASLADVLSAWNGLGYNRRAKYLHEAARSLVDTPPPWSAADLSACLGIGKNTAAAVCAYAYNQPLVFIETNIRTVFIHHFFADSDQVPDAELLTLVEQTLDRDNPREWFWALMDYGSYLKSIVGNLSRQSKHYVRQSAFEGSSRQIRGRILKLLMAAPSSKADLQQQIDDPRLPVVLAELCREGLVRRTGQSYHLPRE